MKTNNTLVPPHVNIALLECDDGAVGLTIAVRNRECLPWVLQALSEILEFCEQSVRPGVEVGEVANINATIKAEVLAYWRTKACASLPHMGYCRLEEKDLAKGPHRLDLYSTRPE